MAKAKIVDRFIMHTRCIAIVFLAMHFRKLKSRCPYGLKQNIAECREEGAGAEKGETQSIRVLIYNNIFKQGNEYVRLWQG